VEYAAGLIAYSLVVGALVEGFDSVVLGDPYEGFDVLGVGLTVFAAILAWPVVRAVWRRLLRR
jgi:hypothetical protein